MNGFKELQWRDLSFDYCEELSQLQVATPNPNNPDAVQYGTASYLPWEWEVQRAFMSIPWTKDDSKDHVRIVTRWINSVDDEIIGACWIRVIDGTWSDSEGHYHISCIARSLNTKGTHLGRFILRDALKHIQTNAEETGKKPYVSAYVDYRNEPSINLFRNAGFDTEEAAVMEDDMYRVFTLDLGRHPIL